MNWHNQHTDDCAVTVARVSLLAELAASDAEQGDSGRHAYLLGAVPEYDNGGDQEVELCTCSRRWSFSTDDEGMHLMVCIDGAEAATVPLRDGDDPFNAEAERGALDRAYEFKQENPDSVVSIVLANWPTEEREYLEARFDVTDLSDAERSGLALEVQVQAESSERHPDVEVEIDWINPDDEGMVCHVCRLRVERHESGMCDSCLTQDAYDRASEPDPVRDATRAYQEGAKP